MRRIIAVLLLLALLPAAASCSFGTNTKTTEPTAVPTIAGTTDAATGAATDAATETTGEETPAPPDPLDVGDVMARLGESGTVTIGRPDVRFDLTREEVEELLADFDELDRLLAEGNDFPAFDALYDRLDGAALDRLATQCVIIDAFWSCDLTDPLTEAAYLYTKSLYDELYARITRLAEAIWQSPFRDAFFDGWADEEIADARAKAAGYTDEMTALNAANDELLVAFRALPDRVFYEESARLFLEMAKNNNRIAELLGYGNYMEYAYVNVYGRDFTPADTASFRAGICEGLIPLYVALTERIEEQGTLADALPIGRWTTYIGFLNGDAETTTHRALIDAYVAAFSEYAPRFKEVYDDYRESKNYYVATDADVAYDGAYTDIWYDLDTPFIYFGPGYHTPYTFLHEFGHYYDATQSGGVLSFDLAETQSQGNEFLFTYWLGELCENETYAAIAPALAENKIRDFLSTIITSSLVNDFECYVYTHLDELAPEDLDGVLISLCDEYGGYDTVKSLLGYSPELYWHYVVMESPAYYISYATSAVPALELYAKAKTDGFAAAIAAYEIVVPDAPEAGFIETLAAAGLGSPFDPSIYTALRECLSEALGLTD